MADDNEPEASGFWNAPNTYRSKGSWRPHKLQSIALAWNREDKPYLVYYTHKIAADQYPSSQPGFDQVCVLNKGQFKVIYTPGQKDMPGITREALEALGIKKHFREDETAKATAYIGHALRLYDLVARSFSEPEQAPAARSEVVVVRDGSDVERRPDVTAAQVRSSLQPRRRGLPTPIQQPDRERGTLEGFSGAAVAAMARKVQRNNWPAWANRYDMAVDRALKILLRQRASRGELGQK